MTIEILPDCGLISSATLPSTVFALISFDSNTFLYYEENILYKKLYAIGKQNYILPSIRCIHLGASSTKSKPSSFLIKCNSDSAFYYLENYCELNVVQKFLLVLAKKSMKIKYKLFKNREK